ncbi:MAG: hypothetical protein H6Q55_1690 [Deltaproteobacteria bacterium]|nr:hypothetical protein [Deltaproteobacteria bacterium]
MVDGVMVGVHPSRAKGFSSEFEQHRGYAQGDDIRHIDWKAYGKFDRYFIKEYRETTNLKAYILLDASASMGYASNGWSKYDHGATLAASLAYIMVKQQDSVGLVLFSDRIEQRLPPMATRGHLMAILKALEERKPRGETSAGSILQELATSFGRRGLVIVISDLLDRSEEVVKGLKQLHSRGTDCLVFQVLDKDELEFPFEDPTLFRDLEEDLKLLADPQAIRSAYLDRLHALVGEYKDACRRYLIDYNLFDTSTPLDKALVRYLSWREKLHR